MVVGVVALAWRALPSKAETQDGITAGLASSVLLSPDPPDRGVADLTTSVPPDVR